MNNQATQKYDGKILKRWYVYTNQGRKIVWAESDQQAIEKMYRLSVRVLAIEPAEGIVE